MSPWVFYVIDVVHSLRIVMIITAVMSIFGWFFILPSCVENESPMFDKLDFLLIFFVVGVVAAILAIFLPSSETMIQMIVAVTGTDIDHILQIEEVTNAILQR